MKKVIHLFLFIWELPQNILGAFLWLCLKHKIIDSKKKNNRLFLHTPDFGINLGYFIFWSKTDNAMIKINENNIEHEYGHSIQSRIFGPLYLLTVGIPSILRVFYGFLYYLIKKKWLNYYNGYPENWADKLGKKYY